MTRLRHPLLAVFLALSLAPFGLADSSPGRKIYQQTLKGTVLVCIKRNGKITPMGTGWILDRSRRLIVTNYHVVPKQEMAYITFPAYRNGHVISDPKHYKHELALPGKVLDSDPRNDLAILQLEILPAEVQELKLAETKPDPGETLHLVGNPGASSGYWVYTSGPVRQLVHKTLRYGPDQELDCEVLEAQMSTNYGDSGSAVVNDQGEVVGVHSGADPRPSVRTISWSIDLDELKEFVDDVYTLLQEKADAQVFERRGLRQMRKKNHDRAIEDFTQALRLDRDLSSAYRNRARAFFLKDDMASAVRDATEALRLDPEDGLAANERGNALSAQGHYVRALEDYTKAITLLPQDEVIRLNRGMTYALKGQHAEAIGDFTEAIRMAPELVQAYRERGASYLARHQSAEAIKDYLRALTLEPNDPLILADLGHAYQENREHDKALDAYSRAMKANYPHRGDGFRFMGNAFFDLKKFDLAIEAYSFAVRHNEKDANAWFWRGAAWEEVGNSGKAKADYDQALKLNPTLKKKLVEYTTRWVHIRNASNQPLKVFVQYEVYDSKGQWNWFTEKQGAIWIIEPGKTVHLVHDDWNVHARKMRLWAESTTTKEVWQTHKTRSVTVCEGSYLGRKRQPFTYTFNP